MKFTVHKIRFGELPPTDEDDEGRDLPKPKLVKLQARRAAGIREAAEVLSVLPSPGESAHIILSARLDMTDVLNALLGKLGRCDRACIATLGYNRRNFRQMLSWLDAGAIGKLSLVASLFFRSHNGDLWTESLEAFRERGQRAICCPSHCKVMALEFANGTRLSLEGSGNLCSNGSARENVCVVNDAELCAFHGQWIEELISRYEGKAV